MVPPRHRPAPSHPDRRASHHRARRVFLPSAGTCPPRGERAACLPRPSGRHACRGSATRTPRTGRGADERQLSALGRQHGCRRTAATLPSDRRVARPPADGRGTSSTGRGAVVHTVHARAVHRSGGPLHAQAVVHTGHARAGRRSGGHGSHRPSFTQTFVHTGHAPTDRRSGGSLLTRALVLRSHALARPPFRRTPLARALVHTDQCPARSPSRRVTARTDNRSHGRRSHRPPYIRATARRDRSAAGPARTTHRTYGPLLPQPAVPTAAAHAGGRPSWRLARTTRRSDTVSRTAPRPNAVAHASRRPGRRSGGPSLARAIVLTDPHQNRPPSDSRGSLGPRLTQTRHAGPSHRPVTQTRHAGPSHSPSPARTAPPTALARSAPGPDGRTPARAGRCPAGARVGRRPRWPVVLPGDRRFGQRFRQIGFEGRELRAPAARQERTRGTGCRTSGGRPFAPRPPPPRYVTRSPRPAAAGRGAVAPPRRPAPRGPGRSPAGRGRPERRWR